MCGILPYVMPTIDIFEEFVPETGWNTDAMLALACEYIDNQQSADAFRDFLEQQAERERNLE